MGPELSSNGLAVAQSSQASSMITAKTTAYRKGLPQSVLVYGHVCTGHSCSRGRDAGAPPAQIPACGFPAPGSSVTLASALSKPRQAPSADADSP
jgi:hypothetical protein